MLESSAVLACSFGIFSMSTSNTLPSRRHGRITFYNSKPGHQYGFITDLGVVGKGRDNVIDARVYFHRSFVRSLPTTGGPRSLVQFSVNTIVEYMLERHADGHNKQTYRAKDITGLYEMGLPFHAGIVTFTPYSVAMKKRASADVAEGQRRFEHITRILDDDEPLLEHKDAHVENRHGDDGDIE